MHTVDPMQYPYEYGSDFYKNLLSLEHSKHLLESSPTAHYPLLQSLSHGMQTF